MISIRSLVLMCCAVGMASANASSLIDIYSETMASDPRLIRAESEAALFQAREDYRLGGLLPKIEMGAQGTRTRRDATSAMGFDVTDYYYGEKYNAVLTQPLYSKADWEAYRAAGLEAKSYYSRFQEIASLIAVDVVDRYTQALAAEDNLSFVTAELHAAEEQQKSLRAQYERKLAKITDVLTVEARVNVLKTQVLDAENQVWITRESLSELVGRDVTEELSQLQSDVYFENQFVDIEQWLRTGLANNKDLESSLFTLKAAAAGVKQAIGQHHPTLNMSLSAQKSDIGYENSQVPETEVYVAALNLRIPIYSGGQVSAQISEARAKLRMAEQEYTSKERGLRKSIRQAYLSSMSSKQRIEATRQAVNAAEKSYEAQKKGFEYGTVTAVDILDALEILYETKRDHRQAFYDFMVQSLTLSQVTGEFSAADIGRVNGWLEPNESDF